MLAAFLTALTLFQSPVDAPGPPEVEIASVLDQLNAASSAADAEVYFSLFAPEARFVGTDASEHWTLEEFRAFAEPHFARGNGWSYPASERTIVLAEIDCRCIAWFEEKLTNASYGQTRGSGVLRLTDDGWKIEQYVLSFAVPNEKAREVVAVIRGQPEP